MVNLIIANECSVGETYKSKTEDLKWIVVKEGKEKEFKCIGYKNIYTSYLNSLNYRKQ